MGWRLALNELAVVTVLAIIVATPGIAILLRGSRRFGRGLDWGPQRRILAIAIALVLVVLLGWLFGFVYDSASHSWADEWW